MARYGQRPENALKRANGEQKLFAKFHVACADDVTFISQSASLHDLQRSKTTFIWKRNYLNNYKSRYSPLNRKILSHNQTTMRPVIFLHLQNLWTWANRPGPWIRYRKCSGTRNGPTTGRSLFLNQSCSNIWNFVWTFASRISLRRVYFSIETCFSQLMWGPWSR